MKNVLILLATVVLLSLSGPLQGQSRRGSTVAPFLTLGMGANGNGLGHAYTAVTSGAESIFWNPAGMARSGDSNSGGSLFMSQQNWFADVNMYAMGLVIPAGNVGRLGFHIGYVDYGRMEITTVDIPDGTGITFGAYDLSVGASYASKLTQDFHFGGTAKLVRQSIWDMTAQTIAVDVGFILETDYLNGMSIGASIFNFGGKMQMVGINTDMFADIDPTSEGNNPDTPVTIKTDKWDLPISFKFGTVIPAIKTEFVTLNVMSDIHQTNDNDINLDNGAQMLFSTRTVQFNVNAGYKDLFLDNTVDSHFTYGVGIKLRTANSVNIGFNLAQVPYRYLGNTTMVDLRIFF
jgi:hypothetical protein